MNFTVECPTCKKNFDVDATEVAEKPSSFKCGACGDTPAPDIMTAYQNVGKTMMELYSCCDSEEKKDWLPKEMEIKKVGCLKK